MPWQILVGNLILTPEVLYITTIWWWEITNVPTFFFAHQFENNGQISSFKCRVMVFLLEMSWARKWRTANYIINVDRLCQDWSMLTDPRWQRLYVVVSTLFPLKMVQLLDFLWLVFKDWNNVVKDLDGTEQKIVFQFTDTNEECTLKHWKCDAR